MKVFLEPIGLHSRAMIRVCRALRAAAPPNVELVRRPSQADLSVLHVIGPNPFQGVDEHQPHVVIQYCLRTAGLMFHEWREIWSRSELVWSYYDLPRLVPEGPVFDFYYAPLGIDAAFLAEAPTSSTVDIGVMTSGYVSHQAAEAIEEVALAAAAVGKTVLHLGPDQVAGMETPPPGWRSVNDISDDELADYYRRTEWVSGLRHAEGFELPVIEGLACGARPIVFDRPEMRDWYDELAVFVPECSGADLVAQLIPILAETPRPVSADERRIVRKRFDWSRIAAGFWTRLLQPKPSIQEVTTA